MSNIDRERRPFWHTEGDTDSLFDKVDAHYLLLLTYLLYEFQKERVNQREVSREVENMINAFQSDISADLYSVIEEQVVKSMAEAVYVQTSSWSIQEAREYLSNSRPDNLLGDMPQPNYRGHTDEALTYLARKRLEGVITPDDAKEAIVRSGLHTEQTRALFEDTYKDILMATRNTDDRLKKVIRDVTLEVIQQQSLLGQGNIPLIKVLKERLSENALFKRLTEDGLIGIVDRGGKRWSVDAYTKMVVNTKLTQAHLEATKRLGAQLGVDLAVVSTHNAVDACNNWEGVVVSVGGRTEGFPALDDAIATNELFHPNCRHHISLIRSLDDLTEAERRNHERKLPLVEYPERRPYRRQRQI